MTMLLIFVNHPVRPSTVLVLEFNYAMDSDKLMSYQCD